MSFTKVIEARMWGVTNQNSDARITAGDSSAGTFTRIINPLRGTMCWDECYVVLQGVSVAGGATGGSYTITIQTDATSAATGLTGLPIFRASNIGPLTKSTVVMTNLHNGKGAPLPTHCFIDQTATGGGIWFQATVMAKQYRGTLGTPGSGSSERVIMGTLLRGTSTGGKFASDAGIGAGTTFNIGTTSPGGTSTNSLGLHRMRLWDHAYYWFAAGVSLSGTHDCNIIGRLGGNTFTVASSGVAGAMSAAGDKIAIASNIGGQSPNPRAIIWDVVSAGGVSDARVVVVAKSGRGSMSKN